MNIFYVYTLAYPDGKVFYVGKGQGDRMLAHLAHARAGKQSEKCEVIRSIWQSGRDVRITKVQEGLSEADAYALERRLIEGQKYENLTNIGKAGLGRPSQGRSVRLQVTVTPEQAAWLDSQRQPSDKGVSDIVFRLLNNLRQAEISKGLAD